VTQLSTTPRKRKLKRRRKIGARRGGFPSGKTVAG